MKKYYTKILLTFISLITFNFNLFSQSDISQTNIDLRENIKQLSDSLLILDIRTKNLTSKINKLSIDNKTDYSRNRNRIENLNKQILENLENINNLSEDVSKNKREIGDLRVLIYEVEVDYKKLVHQLNQIEIDIVKTNEELEIIKQNHTAIYEEIEIIHDKQRNLGSRLNQIPELYFCLDCKPKFSAGLGGSYFPTNILDIPSSFAWSLEFRYLLKNRLNIISQVNFPKVLLRSVPPLNGNSYMIDKWNIFIYSVGINYNFMEISNKFRISGGSSIFYANGKLDNFYNQTSYNTKEEITQSNYGLLLDLEFAYSDYKNKNPLELYLSFNSYIANSNIILSNSVNRQSDLGLFLPSLKTGIRFNFY